MIDIERQVGYRQSGAREDWTVARELVDAGRVRHGLLFAHLALEKALKALVSRYSCDLPPRIHNLARLVELAGVDTSADHHNIWLR
jgi:HEPN domain-containing protein